MLPSYRSLVLLIVLALVACGGPTSWAQAPQDKPEPAEIPADPGWPRSYKAKGHEVIIHQPQIDSWENYQRITIRAAVVIRKEGATDSQYGSLVASADTAVDTQSRTVIIGPRKLDQLQFPGLKDAQVEQLKAVLLGALPDEQPLTYSLDRVLAAVARDQDKAREAKVSLDAPPIFTSESPAFLVTFAGKPRFEKVEGTGLMFATNTNWDIFLDTTSGTYYLLNGDTWLSTSDVLKGKWLPAANLPAELSKLPDNDNWKDVRAALPGKKSTEIPTVFVSTGPAELIVTQGKPQFEPIPGTGLLMVANTESDLFMHMSEKQFYFLTAGRWFRAKALTGPWTPATRELPADFADIPETHEAGDVLASVPGTQQAAEAVALASLPQKVTINRNEVKVAVTYQGNPKFVPIETTTVQYAVNTPYKVFLVDNKYYCCHEGVWFVAPVASGPWAVCVAVPPAIYTIPASHPAYNVTYVYVYDSTPTTVVVGSTAGYSGQYVAAGVVLFGAGVIVGAILNDDDDNWAHHYHSAYFSYGCGAVYRHSYGGFYAAGSRYYGPYGGAGAWSAYNPATGTYARGAYRYGPNGSASVRTAYNPWTGNSAARANVSTPYGSWGRSAVTNGDEWARAGHRSGARGTVGGIQTSEGAGAVAGKSRWGDGAVVAKDKDGDLYAARDGNVYKRDDDGNWSQRDGGDWKPAEGTKPTPRAQGTSTPNRQPQPRTADRPSTAQDLDSQARTRDRGATAAQRTSTERSGAASPQPRAASRSRSGGRGGRQSN